MNTSATGAPDGERFISPWIAASPLRCLLLAVALGSGAHTMLSAESSRIGVRAVPGTCGWYRVLPTVHREAAPIQSVRLGVSQDAETTVYILDLCHTQAIGPDLLSVQIRLVLETSSNPPATPNWLRYQVWIPASGETYDYRNVHTDRALLPGWDRFDEQFLPQPTRNARYQEGFPETMRLLGHVLSLRRVKKWSEPPAAPEPEILRLDPELLIATGRTFRDTEGRRLPQDQGENDGYFLVPESPMNRRHDWDLWWIRDLDRTGQNVASQRYRRLLRAAFEQIHAAFDNGKSFDIAVDDGRTPQGYRTVIRLTDSD